LVRYQVCGCDATVSNANYPLFEQLISVNYWETMTGVAQYGYTCSSVTESSNT
jgi:hypothetical protein